MTEKKRIGIVDTMFARANMGKLCQETILESDLPVQTIRRTVPGFKDLPVAAKKLVEEEHCDIVIALGMAGSAAIDRQCAHEASLGLQWAQLLTNTHILDVMVFEEEGKGSDEKLSEIMADRVIKHAKNALDLLFSPEKLIEKAGSGQRQGSSNAAFFELKKGSK